MSTILTSADGKRRCDATCHQAAHSKCNCICGGRFHGAAVVRTMEAERREIEELILARVSGKGEKAAPVDSADQPLLFGEACLP